MDLSGLTKTDIAYYGFIVGVGVAIALGLLTLLLGFKKGKTKLGVWGLIVIIVGGSALGLFGSIPLFILFLWLIFRKTDEVGSGSEPAEESAETNNELS